MKKLIRKIIAYVLSILLVSSSALAAYSVSSEASPAITADLEMFNLLFSLYELAHVSDGLSNTYSDYSVKDSTTGLSVGSVSDAAHLEMLNAMYRDCKRNPNRIMGASNDKILYASDFCDSYERYFVNTSDIQKNLSLINSIQTFNKIYNMSVTSDTLNMIRDSVVDFYASTNYYYIDADGNTYPLTIDFVNHIDCYLGPMMNSDGKYVYTATGSGGTLSGRDFSMLSLAVAAYCIIHQSSTYSFWTRGTSQQAAHGLTVNGRTQNYDKLLTTNMPVFKSLDAGKAYLDTGVIDDAYLENGVLDKIREFSAAALQPLSKLVNKTLTPAQIKTLPAAAKTNVASLAAGVDADVYSEQIDAAIIDTVPPADTAEDSLVDVFPIPELVNIVRAIPEGIRGQTKELTDALGDVLTGAKESIATVTDSVDSLANSISQAIPISGINPFDPTQDEDAGSSLGIGGWFGPFMLVFLLIYILILIFMIFLALLGFIINIFRIPASTAFLPEDLVLGLEYLKSLEITGIGISVYDFMLLLCYIILFFSIIRTLRHFVEKLNTPG